jgi:ABC-type transporter Mla subunit MlaD
VTAATTLLDSIDTVAAQLDDAAATVTSLVAAQKADLAEARREREAAPDADTGEAIVDAIDGLEKVLAAAAAQKKPADPIEKLDALNAAIAELDTALASARNQTQRLAHARTALAGTLVSAKSQIAAVRGFITAGGGGVGADARTRLREAERELAEAEGEADPVAALDAARRAVTSARDADALARYDARR